MLLPSASARRATSYVSPLVTGCQREFPSAVVVESTMTILGFKFEQMPPLLSFNLLNVLAVWAILQAD